MSERFGWNGALNWAPGSYVCATQDVLYNWSRVDAFSVKLLTRLCVCVYGFFYKAVIGMVVTGGIMKSSVVQSSVSVHKSFPALVMCKLTHENDI